MKKFLFTLAAVLMSLSVFAQTDAKYLYVNTALTVDNGMVENPVTHEMYHEMMLVVSAEFPAYLNAFEAQLSLPEGMTVVAVEPGLDADITYYTSQGRARTFTPSISWTADAPNKFVIANMQGGYDYVDGALVDITTVKWGPGDYEDFVDIYVSVDDETYHGGNAVITTIPSSGIDPRETVNDVGDKSVPHTTDATEPLPDPNPAVVQQPVDAPIIATSMDDNYVYVTITWPTTDGDQVYTGQAQYARPEYGQPNESYDVEAYTTETEAYEESEHATATIVVPAKDPVWQDVAAPVIETSMDDNNVYVTITWPTTTGDKVYTGEYTYARPEYGQQAQSYNVVAYTEADYPYKESEHAEAVINVPAKDPVWQAVDAPVIETTMDDNNVYVTITWPETTGQQVYTGQEVYPRPEYGQDDESYPVEAYTEADYPYEESEHATATIAVPAKDPVWVSVEAPVISYEVGETTVTVTIEWPETTGDHVYTGQYTYDRPAYGEGTGMYEVEAYTEADYPYEESTHAYLTIFVPELAQTQTAKPTITTEETEDGIVVTATGNGTVTLYVEDELVATGTGSASYTIPYSTDPEGDVVAVSATAQAEGEAISDYAIAEVEVPYKPVVVEKIDVDAPIIETEMDDNYVYVDITWPTTDGEHYYNGQAYYERTDETYSVDVEAYTGETDTYNESEHATETIVVPAKEQIALKTYVKVTAADQLVAGKKYIFVAADYAMGEIVNGFGTPVELTAAKAADEVKAPENIAFTLGGEAGAWTFEQDGQYLLGTNGTSLAMGENVNAAKWNINNNNGALDGYRARNAQYDTRSVKKHNTMARFGNYANSDTNSEFALIYVEKEDEPVLEPTLAPGVETWTGINGDHTQYVKFNESEDNCEIQYRVKFEDGEWSDWMPYNGTLTYTENGHYEVEGRAKAEGKDWSEATGVTFVISPMTGLEEVNGDKAVAGVRYFNLAGQEMAQPEGMTIIVTTYTDGTTSAVKVMK